MTDLDKLLSTQSPTQLRAELAAGRAVVGPAQARRLAAHARGFGVKPEPLRVAFVHTYTSDLLDPWLDMAGAVQGFDVQCHHAPYGLALQEARPDSALVRSDPHVTVLLLQREDLHPELSRPITSLDTAAQAVLRAQALERLREVVGLFRAQKVGHLVVTLLPRISRPALGIFDAQASTSEGGWWSALKGEFAAWLRASAPSSLLLDLDEVLARVGQARFFDERFWYSARFPFSSGGAAEVARLIVAVGTVLLRPRAKVIVLDADNTLWGGVVGEDGIDGIKLGADYPGNLYVEFQRRILDLKERGFVIAMCSKNNAADVDEVLNRHPHMLLRDEHFAARRVNWVAKPENLMSLAEELNLGLESFVFVDDSDHECAAVRHALPQVEVVQTPSRAVDVPGCLDQVARLEVLSLTAEDRAKTQMYRQELQRRALLESAELSGSNAETYLARLGMRMTVRLNSSAQVPRLAQLTQKTNQFNLTTRRYDEARIQACLGDDRWLVADFSLADIFGDSGVVGLAMFKLTEPKCAELDTFLMSCRVIGREAEGAFLHTLLRSLADRGIHEVRAQFVKTAKNGLAQDFLPQQGFAHLGDGHYRRDLRTHPPRAESEFPIAIELPSPVPA